MELPSWQSCPQKWTRVALKGTRILFTVSSIYTACCKKWSRTHFHCIRQQKITLLAIVSTESNSVVSFVKTTLADDTTLPRSTKTWEQAVIRCPPYATIHELEFIQHNNWNPDDLHHDCFGNILRIACLDHGIWFKHLLTLLQRPTELSEQHLHISQANTPKKELFSEA